jgi:hypothetical protein
MLRLLLGSTLRFRLQSLDFFKKRRIRCLSDRFTAEVIQRLCFYYVLETNMSLVCRGTIKAQMEHILLPQYPYPRVACVDAFTYTYICTHTECPCPMHTKVYV